MKTMSVYGLLGKIYNCNDDLPKRILFRDRIYELDDYNHYVYKEIDGKYGRYIDLFDETSSWELDDFLREQVEIIENDETEEKKLPEKLKIEQDTPSSNYYIKNEFGTKCALTKHSKIIADKVNELLDYLESKGESTALNYNPNVVVNNQISMKQDPLDQMVSNIKTFSGGTKNDYNYGASYEETIKNLLDYITNLQTIEREYSNLLSENAELQQENDRLNNIINELEKWVDDYPSEDVWYEHITNKLKELKENNNAKNKR